MNRYSRVALINSDSGQGEVWRGKDALGNEVAIKFVKLPVAIQDAGTELRRFQREINCQRELDHPNIVKILGSNLTDEKPFFVMPLADGSLRDLLPLHPGGMAEDEAVAMFLTILDAIAYAHRENVLHRDLKPENILMFAGEPSIADFGLGRRLQSGSTTITIANVGLGTLQYSAPEQLMDGHSGDQRSDVYSLGRIFYEMLTGKVPFPRMDVQYVPSRFKHVVFKATRDDPAERYDTVADMIRDLRLVVNGFESTRSPLQRAMSLFDAVTLPDHSDADARALSRILIEHGDNEELCSAFVRKATKSLISGLAAADGFEEIAMAIDRYADAPFDFDFVDSVADALALIFWASESTEIRSTMLRRLMLLGTSHNRFHIAQVFCAVASGAFNEQVYVHIIAGLLKSNPQCKEFLRHQLRKTSLPPLIEDELAA